MLPLGREEEGGDLAGGAAEDPAGASGGEPPNDSTGDSAHGSAALAALTAPAISASWDPAAAPDALLSDSPLPDSGSAPQQSVIASGSLPMESTLPSPAPVSSPARHPALPFSSPLVAPPFPAGPVSPGAAGPSPSQERYPQRPLATSLPKILSSGAGTASPSGQTRTVLCADCCELSHRTGVQIMTTSCLVFSLIVFVLAGAFFALDMLTCGMQGAEHKLRLRNTTLDTFDTGYNTLGVHGSYFTPSADEFTLYNGDGVISRNGTQETFLDLVSFPVGLVVNDTYELYGMRTEENGEASIDSVSFSSLVFGPPKDPTVTDNGAKFNVNIGNPSRKRLASRVPWFNFGYWTPAVFLRNTFENGTGPRYRVPFPDRCNIEPAVSSLSNASNIPLWMVPLRSANWHQYPGCRQDYDLSFAPCSWFCFSPFLIREIRKTNRLTFEGTVFNGLLIPDFVWGDPEVPEDSEASKVSRASASPASSASPNAAGRKSPQSTPLDLAGRDLYINATSAKVRKLVLSSVPPRVHISVDTNTTLEVQLFLPADCDPESRDYGINSTSACQLHFHGISGTAPPPNGSASEAGLPPLPPVPPVRAPESGVNQGEDSGAKAPGRTRLWGDWKPQGLQKAWKAWKDTARLSRAIFNASNAGAAVRGGRAQLPPIFSLAKHNAGEGLGGLGAGAGAGAKAKAEPEAIVDADADASAKAGAGAKSNDESVQYYTAQHFVTPLRYPAEFSLNLTVRRENVSADDSDEPGWIPIPQLADVLPSDAEMRPADSTNSPFPNSERDPAPSPPPLVCSCDQTAGAAVCRVALASVLRVSWNQDTMAVRCTQEEGDEDSALLMVSLLNTRLPRP